MMLFTKNQRGQSAMEYLLITFLIGVVCLASFKKLGATLKDKIEKTEEVLSGQISFTGKINGR